ncbi:MAG: hypothetical protein JWL69_3002 [Phycisphaerales bacterium]|nr:hypothetical protein [Phycisphaerales bacterium]
MSKGRNPRQPRTRKEPADPPRADRQPKAGSSDKSGSPGEQSPFPPPLKPRRILFWVLAVLVATWLIALLVLYFITVYPNRGKLRTIETDRPGTGMIDDAHGESVRQSRTYMAMDRATLSRL